MRKELLVVLLVLYFVLLTGCVSIPAEQLSPAIEAQELSDHVHFLAQPALKGRKPKSWESKTAQQYLKSRFEAYGLLPWGQADGYDQSFGFGTNVIGVLPGSDPELADEIVVVAAHYDHLGKRKKGIYHGASDNASGVAALLEIAEQLRLAERKPKRSVCFAAFDCEERMLLGSFAFTCREDFENADIAAVVNIDMLGRDLFDVVENTLCAIGTMKYPKLRRQIVKEGAEKGIDIVVSGADFIGPRGDHVPFEPMAIPCLFFTCGHHGDYHTPDDTADKVNYEKAKLEADIILATVRDLTDTQTIELPTTPASGYIEELQALKLNLARVSEDYEKAGLTAEVAKQMNMLCAEATDLLQQESYTAQDRRRFMWKASVVFGPLFEDPSADTKVPDSNEAKIAAKYSMATMSAFYAAHQTIVIETGRKFVRHLIKHKPGLFNGMPKFEQKIYELNDDDIALIPLENEEYLLAVLPAKMEIYAQVSGWLFKRGRFGLSFSFQDATCRGTKDQIFDYCLMHLAGGPEDDQTHAELWQKVLKIVNPAQQQQTYDKPMQHRMKQLGLKNEKEWLLGLIRSDNRSLAKAAITNAERIAPEEANNLFCEIIPDVRLKPSVRAAAISVLTKDAGLQAMLSLVDVIDNNTPCYSKEDCLCTHESYPFCDHPGVRMMNELRENWYAEEGKSMTLGDKAKDKLKELTKKDFGDKTSAWRKWLKAHKK